MQDNNTINSELKNLILSDESLKKSFLVALLKQVYEKNEYLKDNVGFYKQDYDLYEWLLYEKEKELLASLTDVMQENLSNEMINNIVRNYNELLYNEATNIIYTLSRLLYMQNKYKDDTIGEKIDYRIKKWLELIKKDQDDDINLSDENISDEEIQYHVRNTNARIFSRIIPRINQDIHKGNNKADITDILDNNEYKMFYDFIKEKIDDIIYFTTTYNRYTNKIFNSFLNDIIQDEQIKDFEIKYYDEIKALKEKYEKYSDTDTPSTIKLYEWEKYGNNEENKLLRQALDNDYVNKLYELYQDYEKTDDYKNIDQNKEDVKKWRSKADKYINHVLGLKGKLDNNMFTINYMLNFLAYSDYQIQTYNTDNKELLNPKKKHLTAKELINKYKETTQLNGEILNPSKKWGLYDTNKANNNILNIRETIGKSVDNNTIITQKKIDKLKSKLRPTKQDIKEIKDLEELKKEQEQRQQKILSECKDLQADIDLLNKAISSEQDGNEIKKLARRRNKIEKTLREKKKLLNGEGIYFQVDLDGNLTYEKVNAKTKESYKLMINADYDVQNFNQEGRNFLQYIPNIDNVVNQLNEDYIIVDLDKYVDFNGISNPRRTRQRLLKTLTEMRKESYEYSFIDEKGALQEGSLVLIADVMTTEHNGKNTLKVQLGGQFKKNVQNAIINGQIAHVNKEIFKLGHGKNNKKEYMAKELYLYFVRLARTEAKKGLINGAYQKALKISTIIDYLTEINLINYNPYRYSEYVKEPLQLALYMGQELGLYDIKTDAFKYYDDVISSLNNGANVKDKVANFENHLIKITLYNDNTDLESNEKAHETYEANKKKYRKKTTKK